MKATPRHRAMGGTSSRTALPLRLTNQTSANTQATCLVFHHHYLHRLAGGALEFVKDIVELLERDGGLAVARLLVPAKNQAYFKTNFPT